MEWPMTPEIPAGHGEFFISGILIFEHWQICFWNWVFAGFFCLRIKYIFLISHISQKLLKFISTPVFVLQIVEGNKLKRFKISCIIAMLITTFHQHFLCWDLFYLDWLLSHCRTVDAIMAQQILFIKIIIYIKMDRSTV